MYGKTFMVVSLVLSFASSARAGDTVIINLPGGATQTVATGTVATMINDAGARSIVTGNSGDSIIASVTPDPVSGGTTFISVGGATYTVSSSFITQLLLSYQ